MMTTTTTTTVVMMRIMMTVIVMIVIMMIVIMMTGFDKYYRNFPDYSRFSLAIRKNGIFSRFSRFCMNHEIVVQKLKANCFVEIQNWGDVANL